MATIKQIAEKAGVSTASVSRVLNANGFVSEDTKNKIELAMEAVNFDCDNRRRRKLSKKPRKSSPKTILMIWNIEPHHANSLSGQMMMQGISEALRSINAQLMIEHIYDNKYALHSLKKGFVDGVIFHGNEPAPAICEQLKNFPLVWLLSTGSYEFGDRVTPDHTFAGRISCDWLAQKGCRNLCCMNTTPIEYIYRNDSKNFGSTRANAFISRANEIGVKYVSLSEMNYSDHAQLIADPATRASNLVKQFINLEVRPDALFVANELGPYIQTELLKCGITPMKDILLIIGDSNQYPNDMPKTISIECFIKEIGEEAVDLIMRRIMRPNSPQITCFLKPKLIIL